jgi:hypothetical protein
MSELTDLLQYRLFGNVISDWVLALIAFLVTFIVLPLVPGYLARKARHQVGETHSVPVELMLRLIPRTSRLFLWIVAIKAAEAFLHLPASVHRALTILVLVVVWLQIGLWAMAIVNDPVAANTIRDLSARSPSSTSSLALASAASRSPWPSRRFWVRPPRLVVDHARQVFHGRRQPGRRRLLGSGRAYRNQEYAHPQREWRADHHVQRRPAEDSTEELRSHGGAARPHDYRHRL